MGVDISHIIRNDYYEVNDLDKSKVYAQEIIEKLKKELLINAPEDDYYNLNQDTECGDYETSFRLPVYDVDFNLQNGFWRIESYFHYCRIVMHHGKYFYLRRLTFDLARALGKNEAWYAEENYTWNSNGCEYAETTFEQWMEYVHRNFKKEIPEYDEKAILAHGDKYDWDIESVYHDSFKECNELFDSLQKKLVGYRLLGLLPIGFGYLRCEKEGKLYLINEETLEPMFNEPIEYILQDLNGSEFIIVKNGLQAVFDGVGKQLTDFVKGFFTWDWSKKLDPITYTPKRIIYNKEAGIELLRD